MKPFIHRTCRSARTIACLVSLSLLLGSALGQEPTWMNLLEGADLSQHWTTTGNWKLDKDGVLALEPRLGEKGWMRYGAYLWAKEQYRDFEIEFEYKINKGGNSGFFFHVGDLKSPVAKGLEVQISDLPTRKDGKLSDHHPGGIIPGIPPFEECR